MATISEKKAIIELYVGWFNRVPDVAGIDFWIAQFDAGSTLQQISGEFYQAAIHQFSAETGYSVGMTEDAFIAQLYDGVMGRGPTTSLAPDTAEIGYWTSALAALNGDKGALLVQMITEIKAFDSTGNAAIKAVQDKFANKVQTAEILSVTGQTLWVGTTVAEGKAALATVTEDDATVATAVATALGDSANNDVEAIVNKSATTGADNFEGTFRDDSFVATQDTLGLGDKFDGKAGSDTLDISISGTGVTLTGFETSNLEHVHVKSLSTSASTLDMSDVSGASMIRSYETDGAALTFRDIQETSASIDIVDTDEDHTINYDVQALSGTNTVTLDVQEIRPAVGTDAIVDIDFTQDTTGVDAEIENLVINSNTIANNIKSISVGSALTTMDINGSANLYVADALDKMLNTVDAKDLAATLRLDMSAADASVAAITFTGATGDTDITFGSAANTKTITTQAGNDIIVTGNGTNTVDSAAGNDTITAGDGDDTVTAGDGDDTLMDAGGNNTVDMGAGNDTATFIGSGNDTIKGGDGNDTITAAAGQDSIDGGAGDDLIIEAVGDLEVSDTIVGGTGTDTVRILNGDNITKSEAQRVTEVEIFDLEGAGTTLTITDNLIKTATDKSFTVDTETSTGTHTIDMTNITSPDYKFMLKGSETNNEVVIADDATINSMSTMTFGASTADTLRVVDGATITASDLINVTGLDKMILEASSNTAQTWNIDLDNALAITVSPTVPAGSVLNISSSVAGVTVQHNANITVNITGTAANITTSILFENATELTDNADNLIGTDADETFTAESLDRLEAADAVDGNGGTDTLALNFGVFNSGVSLHEQVNKAGISDIEIITFKKDLATGVSFSDVDGSTGSIEAALATINLTDKADTVTAIGNAGITVNAYAGNDTIATDTVAPESATINGGAGNDTITGSTANDILNGDRNTATDDGSTNEISLGADDVIVGGGGDDTVDGGAGNDTITTNTGNDNVTGGTGNDTVDVSSGTDTVNLGEGDDSVTVADDDLSINDTIDGGAGTDTLTTSDTAMTDTDFTNVTTMEVLTLNAATTGDFASEFKESGIRTINGSAGVDDISFENVANDAHLTISGNDGDDIIMGGSGNDTITGGEGADTITGSTGADTINLHEDTPVTDLVVYTRAEDGAQTSENTGYDVIKGFVEGTDRIVIDGSLEAALDANAGGNFNTAAVTRTNEAALDAGAATGLAVYTNTTLQDSDLTQSNFTNVLNLLNTNLQTSAAGDNILYVVQSTNNTGIYFYQENGAGTENIIDLTELKMLTLVDSGLNSNTPDVSKGDSLIDSADISDEDVSLAGAAANLGVTTYSITGGATTMNEDAADVTYTVTTTGVADGNIGYTLSGTGITAADITGGSLTGTVAIAGGTGTFTVSAVADSTTEGDETLVVTLDDDATATVNTTITDSSVTPTAPTSNPVFSLTVASTTINEGAAGTTATVSATITRDNGTDAATIDILVADGTANAGSDYTAIATTPVSFAAGETTKTQDVAVITGDDDQEGDENFTVAISNPSIGTLDAAAATPTSITITGDDTTVVILPTAVVVDSTGTDDSGANNTEDASAGDITFTLAAGSYEYTIAGFGTGDVLDVFDGAALSIVNIAAEGDLEIAVADGATGSTAIIKLTGIDTVADGLIFSVDTFNAQFTGGLI